MAPDIRIRPMIHDDLDDVCAIEEETFPEPWPRESFESDIDKGARSLCLVAEVDNEVVGFLVSWPVVDELHIGDIAVAAGHWNQGIGAALLRTAIADAVDGGAVLATLEVRASNARAIALYERFGFRPVAIRRAYYADNREDAIVMIADLDEEDE